MSIDDINRSAASFLKDHRSAEKGVATGVPGLALFESARPSPVEATLYVPIACLTLQGAKETTLGATTYHFEPGDTTIVSHDVPVNSQVTKATPQEPFRCLVLELDISILRGLHEQVGMAPQDDMAASGIAVGNAGADFADAMARYFALKEDPMSLDVLAPMIYREMHYRLLMAPHGQMLRKLLRIDSHASSIARAIAHIRQHYNQPIAVPQLAQIAGMSPSSFHAHFRSVTETSPLQFQKDLRLIEAKRLMAEEGQPVSATAFDVGYESATQFSRDYARKFGASPRKDIAAIRPH